MFNIYENPVDNFNLISSFLFFILNLFLMIFLKLASGEDCYSKMNKLHLRLYLPYLISSFLYYFTLTEAVPYSFLSLIVGSFIYFSLHYVYLFSLVGLSKKSISINILTEADRFSKTDQVLSTSSLISHLGNSKVSLEFIREDRLKQMLILGWATKNENTFKLTSKGRTFNKLGSMVLTFWNLVRI
jgi:hypothetical protein